MTSVVDVTAQKEVVQAVVVDPQRGETEVIVSAITVEEAVAIAPDHARQSTVAALVVQALTDLVQGAPRLREDHIREAQEEAHRVEADAKAVTGVEAPAHRLSGAPTATSTPSRTEEEGRTQSSPTQRARTATLITTPCRMTRKTITPSSKRRPRTEKTTSEP